MLYLEVFLFLFFFKFTHRSALPSAGHFVDGRCSVVRWGSSLTVTGKGIMRGKSKHKCLL